jgi:hypothetical protein
MDSWSATDDDRPHRIPRPAPQRSVDSWLWVIFAVALIAMVAAASYSYLRDLQPPATPQAAPAPEPLAEAPAAAVPAGEPDGVVRHPLPAAEAEPSLPALDNSDALARDSLVELLGGQAFNDLVIPAQLVRRIVATVDNLPRQTAPRRAIPLEPVPGSFVPDAADSSRNSARYAPYVRVLESVDTRALVRRYVRTYPLFQRAYEELGFPGRYFNDRLIEAIDDMLAAPELSSPPQLVQAKVLYEFADPALESRSAGQKVMMRMGPENAARVKAKLREMRRELGALRKPS